MKLSKTQQTIVDLMGSGWELGQYSGLAAHIRLQEGGLGSSGKIQEVRAATLQALLNAKVIALRKGSGQHKYPLCYELTSAYRTPRQAFRVGRNDGALLPTGEPTRDFASEVLAAEFIGTTLEPLDPQGVFEGAYYLDPVPLKRSRA